VNWYDPDLKLTYELHAAGDLAGGMAACERLLSIPGLPPEIELLVRRNQTWHLPVLARVGQGSFNAPPYWRDQELTVPVYVDRHGVRHHSAFNPSVAENANGEVFCIVRSSNYDITPQGTYAYEGEAISTVNHLLQLHPRTLAVLDTNRIEDEGYRQDDSPFPVRGHEDCRLFHDGAGWCYSATVRDRTGERGMAQMIEADLGLAWGVGPHVDEMQLLSDGRRHEKNWMPWPDFGDGWAYLYSVEPTIILASFTEPWTPPLSGFWSEGVHLLRHARGGTQVVLREERERGWDRFWCLVHETVTFDNPYHKVYTHRVVEISDDHEITAISSPFCFRGMGIEFAAGLVIREDEVVISYGVNDERAYLLRLPLAEMDAMMHPVTRGDRWLA
jgi:hypothetical protein